MSSADTLLPPNATAVERAIEAATVRDLPAPLRELWNPQTCPVELLPYLAWAVAVDEWDPSWPDAIKRARIAASIPQHRLKGSVASVKAALALRDEEVELADPGRAVRLTEWWQTGDAPYTFAIEAPLDVTDAVARRSAAWTESLAADLDRTKPVRADYVVRQSLKIAGAVGVEAAARVATFQRQPATLLIVPPDGTFTLALQTEDGEPFELEQGGVLFEEQAA